MTPPRPRLLVFDLDGTLIDSRQDLVACVQETLAHFGLPALPAARIAGFVGDGAAALVSRSVESAGGPEAVDNAEALAFFLRYYSEHLLDHTHVYPGVLEALQSLQSQRDAPRMAVLTNKPVGPSRRICDALGLSPFFFANYGGNSFPTKKPDPGGLHAVRDEGESALGRALLPAETVMIGDSEVDVRTARNAGVRSIGCTWGFAAEKMLAEAPDAIAHTAADWLTLLAT